MSPSRVLVIDDSTTLRKLVEIAMRGTGFDIDFAATGSDGLLRARAARPDVILLDYLLPDLESTEVVQQLSDDSETAHVPVVVMSANESTVFESFRRFPAVVDFVGKPFTPTEIRSRLESAIKGQRPRETIAPTPEGEDALQLRGNLLFVPILDVLRLLGGPSSTGTLELELVETYRIYIRKGEILMVTKKGFDASSLTQANVRASELPMTLLRQSTKLLEDVLGATVGRFAWRPVLALPDYVEAFGRSLSVTSIALARQRKAQPESPLTAKFLDEVYDRTPRFSEKLAGARLEPEEQRLLGLIDGRTTVRDILVRAEISSDRAAAVFARLRNVDLIRCEARSSFADLDGGAVAVLDTDHTEFLPAVRAHLAKRPAPIETVVVEQPEQLAATVLKQRVRMVLINSRLCTPAIVQSELAPISTAGTITVIGVLDAPNPTELDAMIKAGMHAVLVKPIHVNDLERLLSQS
jgi:CheY-like chemotaxis protein